MAQLTRRRLKRWLGLAFRLPHHVVAIEGEVAAGRVVGKDLGHQAGEMEHGGPTGGLAHHETEPVGSLQDMGVEGDEQVATVEKTGPAAQVDGRPAAHHPAQEHHRPLAERRAWTGHYARETTLPEVATQCLENPQHIGLVGIASAHALLDHASKAAPMEEQAAQGV
jgi:hypothetical protein